MAKNQAFKTWDTYVIEAQHDPFELKVSDVETIVIEAPTGAGMLHAARAFRNGDPEAMLSAMCGDQWTKVEPLLASAPFAAMQELSTDMMVFFDLTDDIVLVGPGGGEVTENDPRKVQALLKAGYRVKGEAVSRT